MSSYNSPNENVFRQCLVDKTRRSVANSAFLWYSCHVDVIVEFNKAAFRHNISKEDILYAFKTKIYDVSIGELPERNLVIGFDRAGNPLELLYNPIDSKGIYIFHAMKLRNSTIEMICL